MKKAVCGIMALFFVASLSLTVFAQNKTVEEAAGSIAAGEVISVDALQSSVVLKQKDALTGLYDNVTVSIPLGATITKDNAVVGLGDLKAGDVISVMLMQQNQTATQEVSDTKEK